LLLLLNRYGTKINGIIGKRSIGNQNVFFFLLESYGKVREREDGFFF